MTINSPVAREEAGHATAAFLLGRKIEEVTACEGGYCRLERIHELDDEGLPINLSPADALTEIVIRFVGHLAAGRPRLGFIPKFPGFPTHDEAVEFEMADKAAEFHGESFHGESAALLRTARAEATELAAQPKFQYLVDVIAKQLDSRPHRLTGKDVEDTLTFHSETFHRLPVRPSSSAPAVRDGET